MVRGFIFIAGSDLFTEAISFLYKALCLRHTWWKNKSRKSQPSDEELFSIRFWTWSVTGSVVCVVEEVLFLC